MIRASRLAYIDNLRSALILLLITHHAVEPYASKGARWTILPDPAVPGLWSFLWVNAAFFMGALFLLAGGIVATFVFTNFVVLRLPGARRIF
jgi:glucans biosynthesis protein C